MADEQLTSKKRKVPDADRGKSSRKKVKTTGVVANAPSPVLLSASSPIPNASSSKNPRQRRPTQRNASPGPSTKPIPQSISSASVASVKKRGRSPDPTESSPSVPSLKSGRIPKPTAKSLASVTTPFKPPPIPRKSKMKTPALKRQKTIPTEVIEVLSSEDEALPPPIPKRKQREPAGSYPITRHKSPLDVIDLCSDDDHPTPKSSPMRTEKNVTVISSSDDETRPSSSKAKPRRPARLIKRTLKAQALLDEKHGVNNSKVSLPLSSAVGAKGRFVRANDKRSRPSKATPASVSATPDPKFHKSPTPDTDQNTTGPYDVTKTPTSALFAENEDGREEEEEGSELQQAIYDSLTQDAQEHPADDTAPLEVAREDEGIPNHVAVANNGDTQALSDGPHSLPTQPALNNAAHSESPPTPAQTLHGSLNYDLPLLESAHRMKSPSPPVPSDSELQPVLDTTPETEPGLQDAILHSLVWKEGGIEHNADTAAPSVQKPHISMIDPLPPSHEPQDESANPTSDHENRVESNSAQSPAIPLFPLDDSYKNTEEVEDSSALLEQPTQFLPENVDGEDEDLGLQNALMASLTQETETVSGDVPLTTMDMSGNEHGSVPLEPVRYSETVAPDDMSTYLSPHLSHMPSPLPDLYGDPVDDNLYGPPAVQVSVVEQASGTAADTLVVGGLAEEPTSKAMMNGSAMDSAPNTFTLQSGDEEEIEDVQMQRAMFRSLASNTEHSEAAGPGGELSAAGENKEELKDSPPPMATPPFPTPVISPLECDSPGDVQKTSKASSESPSPQLSTHSTTPDKPSSSLDDFVSSAEIHTIFPHGVRKPPVSFTYSSEPVTALPRLLTPNFFAQSFLPPNPQLVSWKTVTSTLPVISNVKSEPQTSELSGSRSPTPPDVPCALSEHDDSDLNILNRPEIIPTSLTTNIQPDSSVQAQCPSITYEEFLSEAAEEVEVDLELTDPESFENVPILAAALSESKILMELLKDVQQRASGSPAGDHAVNLEHELPCVEQPQVEASSSISGFDSSGIQQGVMIVAERDSGTGSPVGDRAVNPEHELSCTEQPQVEGKSSPVPESDSPDTVQNYMTDADRDNDAGNSAGDHAVNSQDDEHPDAEVDKEFLPVLGSRSPGTVQNCMTNAECDNDAGNLAGDRAVSSQDDELPGAEVDKEFSPVLGSDSPGVQQNDASGAEGDKDATLELGHINSKRPNHPGKSSSQPSLDSSATSEDSPPPTTPPVQPSSFDFSSFFIRSSSPIDSSDDILKNIMDISLPLLHDKGADEDAYLLSTHSFDYPDDVGVVG